MKTVKKLLAVLLTAAMVAVYLPQLGVVALGEEAIEWTTADALPTNTTDNAGKTFKLMTDVAIAKAQEYGSATNGLTIDLNGHTITSAAVTSNAGVFVFNGSGSHTITDTSVEQTGKLIGPSTQQYVIRVYGNNGATLNYNAGIISGADNTASKCVVYLDAGVDAAKHPVFNMNGGKITGFNFAGSGIASDGSKPVEINIAGGEFSNIVSTGGSGAAINANIATVNISGGLFKNNKVVEADTKGGYGGAVRVGASSTLTITGGTFTGNEAFNGGAIFTTAGINASISNATITGNKAKLAGGVICQGVLTLSGSPVIKDNSAATFPNIYTNAYDGTSNGSVVTNGLTEGADVTISLSETKLKAITPDAEFTVGKAASGDENYIHSDSDAVKAKVVEGDLVFYTEAAEAHMHGDQEYLPWVSANSLPTSGNYYLTGNVTLSSQCVLAGPLNICMNGKTIFIRTGSSAEGYIRSGSAANVLTIDDCSDNHGAIVYTDNAVKTVFFANVEGVINNISNITISGYNSTAQIITAQKGSEFTFTNCTFKDCTSTVNSGMIYVHDSTLNFKDCTFDGLTSSYKNAADAATKVYTGFLASVSANAKVNLEDCVIKNCTGTGDAVGGITLRNGTLNVKGTEFKDNYSGYNGVVYVNSSATAIANIDDCVFTGNSGANAGGVYVGTSGITNIKDSTFTGNIARTTGNYAGAIYTLSSVATRNVLEGANVVKNNVNANGAPADLCLQNADSVFTLKNPTADTEIYLNSYADHTQTALGAITGNLLGTYVWTSNEGYDVVAEEGALKLAVAAPAEPEVQVYATLSDAAALHIIPDEAFGSNITLKYTIAGADTTVALDEGEFAIEGIPFFQTANEISLAILDAEQEELWTAKTSLAEYMDAIHTAAPDNQATNTIIAQTIVLGQKLLALDSTLGDAITLPDWAQSLVLTDTPDSADNVKKVAFTGYADARVTGATLALSDKVGILFYLDMKAGEKATVTKVTADGEVPVTEFTAAEDVQGYALKLDKLSPVFYNEEYIIRTTQGAEVHYSVNSYCFVKQADETAGEAALAVFRYGLASTIVSE